MMSMRRNAFTRNLITWGENCELVDSRVKGDEGTTLEEEVGERGIATTAISEVQNEGVAVKTKKAHPV